MICFSFTAFDLLKKIRYPTKKLRHFARYMVFAHLAPLVIIVAGLVGDFLPAFQYSWLHRIRPMYGQIVCGVSGQNGKLVYVIVPASVSLLIIVPTFLGAVWRIKSISKEISLSVLAPTFRNRVIWYLKLSTLLGICNLFALLANLIAVRCLMLSFILLIIVSLHGKCHFHTSSNINHSCFRTIHILRVHM